MFIFIKDRLYKIRIALTILVSPYNSFFIGALSTKKDAKRFIAGADDEYLPDVISQLDEVIVRLSKNYREFLISNGEAVLANKFSDTLPKQSIKERM